MSNQISQFYTESINPDSIMSVKRVGFRFTSESCSSARAAAKFCSFASRGVSCIRANNGLKCHRK